MGGMSVQALSPDFWVFPPSRESAGGSAWLFRSAAGRSVLVDVPLLKRDLVACDGWASLLPSPQRASFCAPEASVTKAMQATVRNSLLAAAKGLDNVHIFDPTAAFMRDGRVQHRSPEGDLLYVDFHHLSVSGSKRLTEPFLAFMRREGLINPLTK